MLRQTNFSADLILVCNSLDAGGIERVVSTLANSWAGGGRKICVITLHDRRRFYALDPAIHHVVIDRAGLNRLADLLRWIAARLRSDRPARFWLLGAVIGALYNLSYKRLYRTYSAIVYAGESFLLRRALNRVRSPLIVSLGTPINIITLRACRGMERRVIISERNDPRRLSRFKNWDVLARKLYNRADLVTANTRGALRDMSEFVEARKLAFVPNPLELAKGNGDKKPVAEAPPTRVPSPFILNVARLVDDKAHEILLDAFAILSAELDGWRLSIVGDGRLEADLRMQAEDLGISERVDWHGVVCDPYAFYHNADIFALPSRIEGMPNALLEAMSCGLPVIVSDGAPGPLELVEDGVSGLIVPVNDAKALAAAFRRLANDPQLCSRLGNAARERVAEYELPRALAQWESVIGLPTLAGEVV
ncbi:MAG TPA: glycosyltransferase [Pyrinomonadaceae bacterium]|nr:glycosyltransferase [Pyrinomonadaceae bacterium]